MRTQKNQQGNWKMPLPFRSYTTLMPNNRPLAVNRLLRNLNRKPKMKEDYFQFMGKVFEAVMRVQCNRKKTLKRAKSDREQAAGVRDD